MSQEESEKSEFKVIDKRRYDSDGTKKPGDSSGDTSGDVKTGSITDKSFTNKPTEVVSRPKEEKAPKHVEEADQAPTESDGSANAAAEQEKKAFDSSTGSSSVDFASFVMSLAHQTLVLMGEAPNPETNLVSANLEAAKQTIDILGLLEEKTRGNLSAEETHLLTEVLSNLRMAFVQKKKG